MPSKVSILKFDLQGAEGALSSVTHLY